MTAALLPVVPGVWRTSVPSKTLPPYNHTQCYWLDMGQGFVLVDTGDGAEGTSQLQEAYAALGKPLMHGVIITHGHSDHAGGAGWAHFAWNVPAWLNFDDFDILSPPPRSATYWRDLHTLAPGTFPGIEIIEAPGHTPGQVNLFLPSERILLAGDNLLGNSTSVITPPHGHLRTYFKTLDNLEQLNASLALPAHGDLITNPSEYIASYRRHRFERLAQILHNLQSEPLSAAELAQRVYPQGLRKMGESMILSHLEYLIEDHEVWTADDGFRFALRSPSSSS